MTVITCFVFSTLAFFIWSYSGNSDGAYALQIKIILLHAFGILFHHGMRCL